MQYRADHRYSKEAFQIAIAVPVEQRHGVTGFYAGGRQGVGQFANSFVERLVVVAQFVGIDDFPTRLIALTGKQQLLDQQGIGIGAFGGRNYFCRHHDSGS
ncbi:hypothetical protein D3C86_1874550 [compost metagenome]